MVADNDNTAFTTGPAPSDSEAMAPDVTTPAASLLPSGSSYRPILPKPIRTGLSAPSSSSLLLQDVNKVSRSSRIAVAACNNCRRSKLKCDAKRPSCTKCLSKGRVCLYTTRPGESRPAATKRERNDQDQELLTLRDKQADLANLLDALRSRSDGEAYAIFQQLRQGADVSAVLRQITAGDLLLQVRMVPEIKRRYALPYGESIPQRLRTPSNHYLHSNVYETLPQPSHGQSAIIPIHTTTIEEPQYFIPYFAAHIEDSKLNDIQPSLWTSVSTDNELMRKLFHAYFLHEFHWLSIFHKDYFLEDMISGSTAFCSSLLVNAVLALACSCCPDLPQRFEYWNPHNLGYKFFAEAKRLWELERYRKTTLTTLQAAHIINIVFNAASMDKIGTTYCVQAIAMANELGLFKPLNVTEDVRKRNSYAFTAWALFFWTSLQSYHFRVPPLITKSPDIPLPDPDREDSWYSHFFLRYPHNPDLISMQTGQTFKAKCEFAVLINRIAADLVVHSSSDMNVWHQSAYHIEELRKWYHTLPTSLTSARIVFPSQIKLHMVYHNVVIELCTAMMARTHSLSAVLPFEPSKIFDDSRICFETLLRLYYIRHSFQNADTYMLQPLMELGFTAIQQLKRAAHLETEVEDARGLLMLAAKGLADQGKIYQIMFTVFHVLDHEMTREDSSLAHRLLDIREEAEMASRQRTAHTQAQFVSNIVNIGDDPEEQRLGNLMAKYQMLAVNETAMSDAGNLAESSA